MALKRPQLKHYDISYVIAIAIHAFLGLVIYFNESIAKLYFFVAMGYFLFKIMFTSNKNRTIEVLKACAYFVGAEVFFRTTHGTLSYEAGKYMVIVFITIGVFYQGISGKAYPYFVYLMFLVPSIFVASTTLQFDVNFRTNIAFVLSGPVCLGIAALYCYDRKVTYTQLNKVLLYMLLPLIAHAAYNHFYTPDLQSILTSTASNRAASGGFGANQVATALGLGMFIVAIRFFNKSPTLEMKILNLFLFGIISFRALVTLSRGGVYTAIIAILAFLPIYYSAVGRKKRNSLVLLFGLFCFGMVAIWGYSSTQTNGLLDKRYANQNARGVEKSDISTGRFTLFQQEIEGFISHPFLGIGSSRAKDARIEFEGQGVTSHNELSRTLAEHGFLGIIILLILIIKPLVYRTKNKKNVYFYAFMCIWFATINHSSMRIAMPAFIYALALLNVTHETAPLHRKQLKTA